MNKKNYSHIIFPVLLLLLFDIIMLFVGYKVDSFRILNQVKQDNGDFIYILSNSNLMVVIAIVFINTFTIFYVIIQEAIKNQLIFVDNSGNVSKGIKKIEVHLMNYNSNTIAFKHLSAIEAEVGISKQKIHNEIWVLTNNFEEKNDSDEGQELREAIIENLKSNVDYYYIIPYSKIEDMEQLGDKLKSGIGRQKINGKFSYITDQGLDFIPTPYFDIIMYIKVGQGSTEFAESSSQIYYCFSRSEETEQCLYQKVESIDIWKRMIKIAKEYKDTASFKALIIP